MIICLWSLQADATINEFSQGKSTLPNDAAKYFQLEEYGHKLKSIYISRLSWHWLENSQKHLSISLSLSLSAKKLLKRISTLELVRIRLTYSKLFENIFKFILESHQVSSSEFAKFTLPWTKSFSHLKQNFEAIFLIKVKVFAYTATFYHYYMKAKIGCHVKAGSECSLFDGDETEDWSNCQTNLECNHSWKANILFSFYQRHRLHILST